MSTPEVARYPLLGQVQGLLPPDALVHLAERRMVVKFCDLKYTARSS